MKKSLAYLLLLSATTGTSFSATATETQSSVSPWLSRVIDYRPAPGQFINEIPEYESGDTYNDILEKATEQICGDRKPGMISLGSFGGYVIVTFDHPVINIPGEADFKIYGNAINHGNGTGISEPGIVMVSADINGNSLPDDPWYEIAGSDYSLPTTLKNYTVTYYRPDPTHSPDPDQVYKYISDRSYIRWDDSEGNTGYVMKNTAHTQDYWPLWLNDEKTLSFTGTRLASNAIPPENGGSNYNHYILGEGYVDNTDDASDKGFDISKAVDFDRNPVNLTSIDFIRIHTAVLDYCGWLGETSTEVAGGEDLHPSAVSGVVGPYTPGSFSVFTLDGFLISNSVENLENISKLNNLAKGMLIVRDNLTGGTHKIFVQ